MCGRFVQERSITELAGVFEAEPLADQLAAGRLPLHSRMPVVLLPEHWAAWLDPESPDPAGLLGHLTAAPSRPFELVPVNRLVNDVRNEGPALIEPAQVQYEFGAGAAEVRPVELSLWSEPAVEAEGPARRQRDR